MPTLVFLIDVDNTLIDNDFVKRDLDEHIKVQMGETVTNRFGNSMKKHGRIAM